MNPDELWNSLINPQLVGFFFLCVCVIFVLFKSLQCQKPPLPVWAIWGVSSFTVLHPRPVHTYASLYFYNVDTTFVFLSVSGILPHVFFDGVLRHWNQHVLKTPRNGLFSFELRRKKGLFLENAGHACLFVVTPRLCWCFSMFNTQCTRTGGVWHTSHYYRGLASAFSDPFICFYVDGDIFESSG